MKQDVVKDYFNHLYEAHGQDVKSLGWSEGGQRKRFEVALSHLPQQFSSILDVGCGFGDFAAFMDRADVAYTGWDINENFIKGARKLPNATFEVKDIIIKCPEENSFDVAISIGAFNVQCGFNMKAVEVCLKNMYQGASKMCLLSATSIYADEHVKENKEMFFYDPTEVFKLAKRICRNVELIHNYMPHDFMIKLYKD
jgi:SAM-dependent methyltransferase